MPDPLLYLRSMGAAAIVSATCVLAMAGLRRPASTTRVNAACILGIGLGIVIGFWVMSLQLAWPPVNALDRFLTVVIPAALGIELVAGFQRVPQLVVWLLRTCLAAAIPRILLHGSVYLNDSGAGWASWQSGIVLAASGASVAGLWGLLFWLSRRSGSGVSISLALCLATQCAGMAVMMAGYIKGGAAAFPLAATLATTTVAARLIAKVPAPAIVGLGIVNLCGILFIGRFFGRLTTGCTLAILLAPLLCWATEIPLLRQRKPWLVGSLRLVLVAIPLLAVLVVMKRDFDRNMAPLLGKLPVTSGAATNYERTGATTLRVLHAGR